MVGKILVIMVFYFILCGWLYGLLIYRFGNEIISGKYLFGELLFFEDEVVLDCVVLCNVYCEVIWILVVKGLVVVILKVGMKVVLCDNWCVFDLDVLVW